MMKIRVGLVFIGEVLAGVILLPGCASHLDRNDASEDRRNEPRAIVSGGGHCKDGKCWRDIETGEFIGNDGELLPPPKDAQ